MTKISIQSADFELCTELDLIRKRQHNIGAIVNFVGLVRDLENGKKLQSLYLEHYPMMSENVLHAIAKQAENRWQINDITLIHRIGHLSVSAQIVLVIATSKHRKDAFEACQFMMDFLKTDAPFWKKECTKTHNKWVEAKSSDLQQHNKWLHDKQK